MAVFINTAISAYKELMKSRKEELMRNKWINNSIYLLIVILLLTGCNFLNKSSVSKQTKDQPIECLDFKVNFADIEKLSLPEFEILNKVYLNIIGLDIKECF